MYHFGYAGSNLSENIRIEASFANKTVSKFFESELIGMTRLDIEAIHGSEEDDVIIGDDLQIGFTALVVMIR